MCTTWGFPAGLSLKIYKSSRVSSKKGTLKCTLGDPLQRSKCKASWLTMVSTVVMISALVRATILPPTLYHHITNAVTRVDIQMPDFASWALFIFSHIPSLLHTHNKGAFHPFSVNITCTASSHVLGIDFPQCLSRSPSQALAVLSEGI